jgi:3D (Asp-Asp-Asp) domain-containing protein
MAGIRIGLRMNLRCSLLLLVVLFGGTGCFVRDARWTPARPLSHTPGRSYKLITTGYCPCGSCCGWKRNWLFRPVASSGPNRGKPKAVGYTASGVRAKSGTIAADTSIFPFGTVMYVPGYGYGKVEDRGSGIKGHRIDLYFRSHNEALKWGRVTKKVTVWKAGSR